VFSSVQPLLGTFARCRVDCELQEFNFCFMLCYFFTFRCLKLVERQQIHNKMKVMQLEHYAAKKKRLWFIHT